MHISLRSPLCIKKTKIWRPCEMKFEVYEVLNLIVVTNEPLDLRTLN